MKPVVTLALLPELRAEIHPTLNDSTFDFDNVSITSKLKVWWQCQLNHVWESSIQNRAIGGTGCPYCAGQKVWEGFNDLKTTCPEIASTWHPVKNDDMLPTQFSKGSNKKVWWLGECGHEWITAISKRTTGSGCTICAGKEVLSGFNDLETHHPAVAGMWHPTKNGSILPSQVTPSSNKIAWWMGECGHEWDAKISEITHKMRGCPICAGKRILPGFNDLAFTNPVLASQWNTAKNDPLLPTDVTGKSGKKVWWLGGCGHEWEATILSRHQGNGCPVCANQKVVAGFNDLATTHPHLAMEWDADKNPSNVTPYNVTAGTTRKVWWKASCNHSWQGSISNRSSKNRGCPYCANQKVIVGFNDVATTHPEIVSSWHPTKNNDLQPTMFVAGSTQKIWWQENCGHEWEIQIFNKVSGVGCPYCGNLKIIVGFNDLATTHPDLSSQWHPIKNSGKTIEEVTFGSSYKAWWVCEKNHEWATGVTQRTRKNGSNCPECSASTFSSKGEKEIADFLKSNNVSITTTERKVLPKREIDIYVPAVKIGIEFNGLYWHSEIHKSPKYHYEKWLAAKEAGIQLIQIWEDEWRRNPEQIKSMLLHKLGLSDQEKVYARKTYVSTITKNQAEVFLNQNHIQGYVSGSHYLGLLEKDTDEIVSVLVLKKETDSIGLKAMNIVRYATGKNVVGGFTKLISYAEKNFVFDKFITFSDNCVSDGGLYENNGFIADKQLAPDYMYLANHERKHKFGYRLKKFKDDPNLLWEEGLTEKQLADLNGIPRIWDAGKTRWVRKISKR